MWYIGTVTFQTVFESAVREALGWSLWCVIKLENGWEVSAKDLVDISYYPVDILSASLFPEVVSASAITSKCFNEHTKTLSWCSDIQFLIATVQHSKQKQSFCTEGKRCGGQRSLCVYLILSAVKAHSHILLVSVTVWLQLTPGGIPPETHFSLAALCECYFFAPLHAPILVPYKLCLAYLTS